jgi:hypothetical protein
MVVNQKGWPNVSLRLDALFTPLIAVHFSCQPELVGGT